MLSRSERLSRAAFAVAFAEGRVLRHPLLQLRLYRYFVEPIGGAVPIGGAERLTTETNFVVRGPVVTPVRAAFVVPRRVAKASGRNRLRRRLGEVYRLHPLRGAALLGEGRARGGEQAARFDLIFIAAAGALTASPEQLRVAMDELLRRAARDVQRK